LHPGSRDRERLGNSTTTLAAVSTIPSTRGHSAKTASSIWKSSPGRITTWLAVSPDGAWILYTQTDRVLADILILEGLE
jgi:hypothetical protein